MGQRNSVCILSSRERGAWGLASHRVLQQLVEEKTQRMKWQSQVNDLFVQFQHIPCGLFARNSQCNVSEAKCSLVSLSQLVIYLVFISFDNVRNVRYLLYKDI